MHDTPTAIAIIAFAFLIAGAVKGVIDMGLATVAMGLLGLVVAPVEAAALLVVPSLATNVWQMVAGPALRVVAGHRTPSDAGSLPGS